MRVGQVIADRFRLDELAGSGGMSNVYRAYDTLLERPVAIKVLHERYSRDDGSVERFRREAKAIAQLSHPNIVTVIDRGEWEEQQFIVFEYVEGETVKDLVLRQGPLTVREALALVREIALGLACAHEHGVVHRDVKPQNVVIDAEGTAKVTDFGIARSLDLQEELTTTGTLLGTSDYLAPEQASGGPVDQRSDQYALGALLYELLTGEVPYPAGSPVEAAMRHRNDPVPSVREARPEVPPEVDELVQRALAKEQEERFQSTGAFLTAVEACLDRFDEDTLSDLPAISPRRSDVPRRKIRRRRASLAVVLVLLVAGGLAAVGVFLLRDGGERGPSSGNNGSEDGDAAIIQLRAASDYDPEGDETEHPESIAAATDGDRATFWTTETYGSFDKSGVGIVLRTSAPIEGGTVVVRADDDGGYTAEIQASTRRDGGFEAISDSQTVDARTTFELDTGGEEYRFLLVWITELGPSGRAHVNEVAIST